MSSGLAVSYTGTREELDALGVLARQRKTSMGKLVASAVRKVYGDELAPLISFFETSDSKDCQMTGENDDR